MRAGLLGVLWGRTRRRQTPFSPSDIANLALWLDASDASTVQQVGGFVSQWNDKSTNTNNFTQANGARQPTYTASPTPRVQFTNKWMAGASPLLSVHSGDFHLFILFQETNMVAAQLPFTWSSGSAFVGLRLGFSSGGTSKTITFYAGTGISQSTGLAITDTNWHILELRKQSGNMSVALDGGSFSTPVAYTSMTLTSLSLGNRDNASEFEPLMADVNQVLLYASNPTDSERANIINWLKAGVELL